MDRLQWFRDARFGLFFHWGLYSLTARNEWEFYNNQYTADEYRQLADRFDPQHYDPESWARLAVESGARYMVLTTRHHDGFCLFDSQHSDFTSAKTAARRDLVAPFVEACRKYGLKVGLYYSLGDWRYKGAFDPVRYPESWEALVEQSFGQTRELLTNYGHIDLLFYDGYWGWPGRDESEMWRTRERNAMLRAIQPHIVLHPQGGPPSDYDSFENHIGNVQSDRPWEMCLAVDDLSWGHVPYSPCQMSSARMVRWMVECAAGGGNLLLNTGPQADGILRPEECQRIREAGAWLQRNGAAIYGSTRSPLSKNSMVMARWIGSKDPNIHYLALLGWSGGDWTIPLVEGQVSSVTEVVSGRNVGFHYKSRGRLILENLPPTPPDEPVTIFRVQFNAPPAPLHRPVGPEMADWIQSVL